MQWYIPWYEGIYPPSITITGDRGYALYILGIDKPPADVYLWDIPVLIWWDMVGYGGIWWDMVGYDGI